MMSRRARILATAGTVVVLAVAAAGIIWWLSPRDDAEAAAQRFVDALSSGDRDAMQTLLPDLSSSVEAFSGASAYISDARLSSEEAEDEFSVTATLDGESVDFAFRLVEEKEDWRVDASSLSSVAVTATRGSHALVGGALVPLGTITLPPAVYPIEIAPVGILEGSTTLVVDGTEATSAAVDATLAPRATTAAQRSLTDYLASCTVTAAQIPPACGIKIPWGADFSSPESFAYRIDSEPAVTLDQERASFLAEGGDLVITVSGLSLDGTRTSATYRDEDWTLRGAIDFDAEALVLRPF